MISWFRSRPSVEEMRGTIIGRMRDAEEDLVKLREKTILMQIRKSKLELEIAHKGRADEFQMRKWVSDNLALIKKQERIQAALDDDRAQLNHLDDMRDTTRSVQSRNDIGMLAKSAQQDNFLFSGALSTSSLKQLRDSAKHTERLHDVMIDVEEQVRESNSHNEERVRTPMPSVDQEFASSYREFADNALRPELSPLDELAELQVTNERKMRQLEVMRKTGVKPVTTERR